MLIPVPPLIQIAKSVRDSFNNLEELEVYAMEGLSPSGTLHNIYMALAKLGLEKQLKFIPFSGTGFPQVGTQNGEIFNPTTTFQKKSAERIAK